MAKQKLVSFRCDEPLYQALSEVAAQREMKVGELARELVMSCLSGKSAVTGRPWVRTVEAMLGEAILDTHRTSNVQARQLPNDQLGIPAMIVRSDGCPEKLRCYSDNCVAEIRRWLNNDRVWLRRYRRYEFGDPRDY